MRRRPPKSTHGISSAASDVYKGQNYDGVNKHKTVIGDEVRIGSNCVLVAPVKLGNKVTTGAGSTITKNVEDNKLALARARQTVIEGWVRPEKGDKK